MMKNCRRTNLHCICHKFCGGEIRRKKIHLLTAGLLAGIVLGSFHPVLCRAEENGRQAGEPDENAVEEFLAGLTLEEKIAQMFLITPEALVNLEQVTAAGPATEECFGRYPVGGLIYFGQNIESRQQLSQMLENMQEISMKRIGLPAFLAVDEEGGSVARVYGSGIEGVPYIGDMYSVGQTGDTENARGVGKEIGTYLSELHFNVDFAPVADIFSNPENTVIGNRAFGSDAETVAGMAAMEVEGLREAGVLSVLKHFPGHGDTAEDSHEGYACSLRTMEELRAREFIPFQAGIDAGANFVMAAHISLPNIPGEDRPVSLSYKMLTEVLRGELGFSGIIITDAMNMGAIADNYSSGEAAVLAIEAGADMLLMPADFGAAYDAVRTAVENGTVTQQRIDESVRRIIRAKWLFQ